MGGSDSIIKGIIAIFLIGIIYLGMLPTISNLAEDPIMWEGVTDPNSLFLRDNAVTIFYASGFIFIFIIIIWILSAVTAKGAVSQYG